MSGKQPYTQRGTMKGVTEGVEEGYIRRIDIDIINRFFEYTNDNIITSSCV